MKEFVRITSKENSLIKSIISLQNSSKTRRENNQFVLEGLRLCRDAMYNDYKISTFVVSDTAYDKHKVDVLEIGEKSENLYIVPDTLFKKFSDTVSPQGLLCLCEIPDFQKIPVAKDGNFVALENLSDPSNIGAIARTAEAMGINGIFISRSSCDPFSSKALRASMGALLRIPVIVCDNLVDTLKGHNLRVYASVVNRDATDITKVNFQKGSAALIGNEANGLCEETINYADERITIKMSGKAESLNAAAAASIIIWEMCK
ncbi:MAG: RNA methyltransferase [Clostridia bacterium]|nr:RNA methyltransferase [Clostridia bacterium]